MHRHRIRLRLEVDKPVLFKDTKTDSVDPKWSLTLVDFLLTPYKAEWTVRLSNGELIEGRLNSERALPYWSDSSLLLAYPVQASFVRHGTFRPEFIMKLPSHIVLDDKTRGR